MAYNVNTYFIFFLPAVCLCYQLAARKNRWKVLLLSSLVFFWLISRWLLLWCLADVAVLLVCTGKIESIGQKEAEAGSREERERLQKISRTWCGTGIGLLVFLLVFLKYFIKAADWLGFATGSLSLAVAAPIGISFYTLQAVGYLLDVHWKRIRPEKNPFRLALFLMFFPILMEGPILRYDEVAGQLYEGRPITEESFSAGALRILLGLCKRMLVSDRMYTMVNALFDEGTTFHGVMSLITIFAVTMQLYLEFSGTIDIVIGSARLFDIRLPENFRQPFFSKSGAEFWRRWHISLGSWFRNYIFFPVTTSAPVKKWGRFGRRHCGKYVTMAVTSLMALFPVWMLNGLWHGAQETAVLYGVYYLLVLQTEVMLTPVMDAALKKMGLLRDNRWVKALAILRTWVIIGLGETLYRAASFRHFRRILLGLFTGPIGGHIRAGRLLGLGVDAADLVIMVTGIVLVALLDFRVEKNPELLHEAGKMPEGRRYALAYAMIMLIVLFGAYGAGYAKVDLIYAGF